MLQYLKKKILHKKNKISAKEIKFRQTKKNDHEQSIGSHHIIGAILYV